MDTRTRTTGELLSEANIYPDYCGHCGADNPGMSSRADDTQLRGKGDWTWQCQGCGRLVHLTRATIVRRWKKWNAGQA